MDISIVIPVYNEAGYLKACLDAIAAQTIAPREVIIVDNNSNDQSVEIAKSYKFVKVIKESRQGAAFAQHTGFNAAKTILIARIDADTVLPPDWIEKTVGIMKDNPSVSALSGPPRFYGIAFPRFLNAAQTLIYQRMQRVLVGTYMIWGANMAIRRSAWQKVASACSLRTDIDEDIDLSLCLKEGGLKVLYAPELPAAASFQRGRLGVIYTVKYISSWPRDYLIHRIYVRALVLCVIVAFGLLVSLPFLLLHDIRTKLGWRSSRRDP